MKKQMTVLLLVGLGLSLASQITVAAAETNAPAPNATPPARALAPHTNLTAQAALTLQPAKPGVWKNGVGEGFLKGTEHIGLTLGPGLGVRIFGSSGTHDMVLGGLSYGRMLGDVKGEGSWLRGNWEWRLEVFGGIQYWPQNNQLAGLTPHLRYNLATGTRWVPFADIGAGVTETTIGAPDLGGRFQFNLQAGVGVNYFLRPNLAVSVETRFLHLSNAGTCDPNLGINNCLFLAGLNWFF
jgi:lipid A 3-O-deacylase